MENVRHAYGGIDWYCRRGGSGPTVVLIPSGEGDCWCMEKTAAALSATFDVLTFDTPGFSRTTVPDSSWIRMEKLADQIADLVRSLGIERATFYGCSSAGLATFDLVDRHPDLVRNAVVHEAALNETSDEETDAQPWLAMGQLSDEEIADACAQLYATVLNDDQEAWAALGPEYHQRLRRNYVTWIREYNTHSDTNRQYDPAAITKRPLTWSIGSKSTVQRTIGNIRLAGRAGVELQLLPSLHFPQVSIPDRLAQHIRTATAPHLGG